MLFLATTLLGEGGGDDGMNPKPSKKLSLGAESYGTIAGKGFFTQSQVLLSSIVAFFPLQIYIYIYIYIFLSFFFLMFSCRRSISIHYYWSY